MFPLKSAAELAFARIDFHMQPICYKINKLKKIKMLYNRAVIFINYFELKQMALPQKLNVRINLNGEKEFISAPKSKETTKE